MASPHVRWVGMKELQAALRSAPKHIRAEAKKDIVKVSRGMLGDVRQKLRTSDGGKPFHHGGKSMRPKTGRFMALYRRRYISRSLTGVVGFQSPRERSEVFYAHFFFRGTVNQPARPFHDQAFEFWREEFEVASTRTLERVIKMMGF